MGQRAEKPHSTVCPEFTNSSTEEMVKGMKKVDEGLQKDNRKNERNGKIILLLMLIGSLLETNRRNIRDASIRQWRTNFST